MKKIYLDNAATTQKPINVTDKITEYYQDYCANINRSPHSLCAKATKEYEDTRSLCAKLINANEEEIVFTKGTTNSINIVAHGMGQVYFNPGDEIILTISEHHANFVPWFLLKERLGLTLKIVTLKEDLSLDIELYKNLFSNKTKLVTLAHISNVLGKINPIKEMVQLAKEKNVPVLIDAAQSIAHLPVDIAELGADFLAFSAHKVYGPTGVGVLYLAKKWQEILPPFESGGDMIEEVSLQEVKLLSGYKKFEAGTPNIAGVIGFKGALEFLNSLNKQDIYEHERKIFHYGYDELSKINGIKIIGDKKDKISLLSFVIDGLHPHDLSSILDSEGISIRAGHLCAKPLIKYLGYSSVARASFSFYNSMSDVDALIFGIKKAMGIFCL